MKEMRVDVKREKDHLLEGRSEIGKKKKRSETNSGEVK